MSNRLPTGDTFEAGEILFEVETDKAQIEVEAQDDGRIAKIVQAAGDGKVSVNATIAYLTDDPDEDVSNFTPPLCIDYFFNDVIFSGRGDETCAACPARDIAAVAKRRETGRSIR